MIILGPTVKSVAKSIAKSASLIGKVTAPRKRFEQQEQILSRSSSYRKSIHLPGVDSFFGAPSKMN
ncbi:UNVERIFIED_ORG: hypothetical protein ABRZ91_002128 [Heyndrickxia coagulans]